MAVTYIVTPEVLSKFQEPFGVLIQGPSAKTVQKLKSLLVREKPPMVISVGDTVSRNFAKHHVSTQLSITDNKSHRRRLQPQSFPEKCFVKVKNPQGTITPQAVASLKEALESEKPVHILVEGEEDLLTLIAVLYAPKDAIVVYGQPHVGVVVVKVTPEKRAEAERILKSMKTKKEENYGG
jgi:uncharacterized protein (UPF0218 family)